MTKVVLNRGDGEFFVHDWVLERFGLDESFELSRNNPLLIQILEKHGCKNCGNENLEILTVPDDATDWFIESYGRRNEKLIYIDGDGIRHTV